MKKNMTALMRDRNGAGISGRRFLKLSEVTMTISNLITSTTNVTKALLLAAGTGTRLQPLTLDAPQMPD